MKRKLNVELTSSDTPELTAEWFARSRPAAVVLPELFGETVAREMLKPKRGRPPVARPKEHVNIRLDADILASFRCTGDGWQTRMNRALREWLETQSR